MIPRVTIFMPLHSSDSLYFLLSFFRHNVSDVSPPSPPPLIPLPLFNSPSPPAHLHLLIAHSVSSSITLSPLSPVILHPLVASALVCLHSFIHSLFLEVIHNSLHCFSMHGASFSHVLRSASSHSSLLSSLHFLLTLLPQ